MNAIRYLDFERRRINIMCRTTISKLRYWHFLQKNTPGRCHRRHNSGKHKGVGMVTQLPLLQMTNTYGKSHYLLMIFSLFSGPRMMTLRLTPPGYRYRRQPPLFPLPLAGVVLGAMLLPSHRHVLRLVRKLSLI